MKDLSTYISEITSKSKHNFVYAELFAKILAPNDDSSRHGILIPTEAYSFFPPIRIPDPNKNAFRRFQAFDCVEDKAVELSHIYYQRYPEHRITRVSPKVNDRSTKLRLVIFVRTKDSGGPERFFFDFSHEGDSRLNLLVKLIFGDIRLTAGAFVIRPIDSTPFAADSALSELLRLFDGIRAMGWVDNLRAGDTGIGYTFESLLGIRENNDQMADFRGIEVKCKGIKEGKRSATGKTVLFQAGPKWLEDISAKERIRTLGARGPDGLYSCYSQVTTRKNNLGLSLSLSEQPKRIDLDKNRVSLGYWSNDALRNRLHEKHSRAVFVKASVRGSKANTQFRYEELIYCEKPSIDRFLNLVKRRGIVFEFTMSEKSDGRIRNHGYPWRLCHLDDLENLFTYKVRLRPT